MPENIHLKEHKLSISTQPEATEKRFWFLTCGNCVIICQVASMNCVNTGEISLLSPARNPHLSRIMSPMSRTIYCHAPVGELVPEVEPVLLYEGLVALDGAVVWINDELGQGAGLTGPVPAVGAVYEDVLLLDS